MTLHQDKEAFKNAIIATAQHFNIREVYIEKDYWVSYVLKQLSLSDFKEEVIFKGGTSLSKAYHCIDRFSEDIDLAIEVKDRSGNQIKNLLSKVQKTITQGLPEITIEGITSKYSKYRKTAHEYERVMDNIDFGQASDLLILETNAFTSPNPNSLQSIQSYIAAYILSIGQNGLITQYELEAFEINCLNIERTFTEKILSLVRMCYLEQPIEALKNKIRHIYDLERMLQLELVQDFLQSDTFFQMIGLVKKDDSSNHEFMGEWMQQPLHKALLFDDIEGVWEQLETTYLNDFSSLVYGELPESAAVLETLGSIEKRLVDYDKR